ncbi:MAG: TonB-dependent receptor plug domain-containing protein [Caldithrix sp.]|nr:TonB-dependent receptor plug domain-containing protein [Caldithrix sp.]
MQVYLRGIKGVKKVRLLKYVTSLILLFGFITVLPAGNTGKIAGRVLDKETGEPLVGVNVYIINSSFGAATDEDGFFYILQVPPGKYDLRASYVGYHNFTIRELRVQVDLTTTVNIELTPETMEAPVIEVVAEQNLVQKDITSTRRTTTRSTIEQTPGLENTSDIFKLQGASFVDAAPQAIQIGEGQRLEVRDESIKNVHVRGGRGGEILYMVDGMPVTHPLYGGRSVLELNVIDVEEVELLTGAFNAEYGQAQSGVVNITTRSGGEKFMGGVEHKTDVWHPLGASHNLQYTSFYLGGPELITRNVLPSIGLEVPGKMNFFISGNGNVTNTAYSNSRTRDEIDIFGIQFDEKQDNQGNLNTKLDWQFTDQMKLSLSYHGSWKQWSRFSWPWQKYPDHMVDYSRNSQNWGFRFNHTVSKSTFYNINFSYLGLNYRSSLDGTKPYEFWNFYPDSAAYANNNPISYKDWKAGYGGGTPYEITSSIEAPNFDLSRFYDNDGYENNWRNDLTSTFTAKGDLTSQIHPEHLVKTGYLVQYHDIKYVDIQDGGTKLSYYGLWKYENEGQETAPPPGPFPEFGQNRWVFNSYPLEGGFYIQDKYEKESLIINAGLRLDWFVPGETVFDEDYQEQWEAATGQNADWKRLRYAVSPRFGISFPISQKTVVFFSYGHFNQLPELQFFYRDPYSGGFTGNPGLDYEQTILYEFGLTHQFARDWALDVKSYSKDISQQVGSIRTVAALGLPVDLYDNNGYSRARGLEFELNKRYSYNISGKATYTVQWATGYSSSAFEDYIRSQNDFPNPIRERPTNWDIRHQVVVQSTLSAPKKDPINLFGVNLPANWDMTVLYRFSTGQPYTPGTNDPAEAQKKENAATGPSSMTTDLKIRKTFDVYKDLKFVFYADIFNVFDQKNPQLAYGFNTWTGEPYKYGDIYQNTDQYYDYYVMYSLMDPRQYSLGRYAKFGVSINW